ncbi:MAG: DEAD/DEAH box helicase, partial [Candidatus Methanomethylophilaceae archaeon]|nr:DEAD/DEAH box helicase [Candidatus Methanomethylophilaceae archaeon]
EKKDDFDRFADLGVRTHLCVGDYDSEDNGIDSANVVIATSEKADSILRHGNRWFDGLGMVIADEIHMIHDPGRGPTLEVVLTKLMRRDRSTQIVALSATITNAEDLARWLHATLVRSEWRPIPLKEGVFYDGTIRFSDGSVTEVPGCKGKQIIAPMVRQTLEEGGQCIVFVNSRRSSESLALELAGEFPTRSSEVRMSEAKTLEGDNESTEMGKKLLECYLHGTAFHNAGLTPRQRKFIEDNFRERNISCIVATPTLAAGINLPARRVIIRDTTRFEDHGNVPIPVMEIKQMSGRAGRPRFDPYGEAVLVAKDETYCDHLQEEYIGKSSEIIASKLINERSLRTHVLGLVSTMDADSVESIADFLKDTFFGHTFNLTGVESIIERIVDVLVDCELVDVTGRMIRITPFGKRISDMYLDPDSALILKKAVMRIDERTPVTDILFACASTPDVLGMYPKAKVKDEVNQLLKEMEDDPNPLVEIDPSYYEFVASDLCVAMLVEKWMDERSEQEITDTMGIGPGDIRSRVDMMDWMVYAMNEVALIFNPDASAFIRPLRTRIRYGVKAELSDLVSLRGVGRTRARALFDAGIRCVDDVVSCDEGVLAAIPHIGKAMAQKLKEQTGSSGTTVPEFSMSASE